MGKNNNNLPANEPGKFKKFWKKLLVGLGFAGMFAGATVSLTKNSEPKASESKKIESTNDIKKRPDVNVDDYLKLTRAGWQKAKVDDKTQEETLDVSDSNKENVYKEINSDAMNAPKIITGENGVTQAEYSVEDSVEGIVSDENFDVVVEETTKNKEKAKDKETPTESITVEEVKSLEQQVPDLGDEIDIGVKITADKDDIESGSVSYNPDTGRIEVGAGVDKVKEEVTISNDNENGGYEVGDNEEEKEVIEAPNPFMTSLEEQVNAYDIDYAMDKDSSKESKEVDDRDSR
jgi:hypothetical protein